MRLIVIRGRGLTIQYMEDSIWSVEEKWWVYRRKQEELHYLILQKARKNL